MQPGAASSQQGISAFGSKQRGLVETESTLLTVDEESTRPHLTREEVPLPPGGDFSLDILCDEFKEAQRALHMERVRRQMEDRLLLHDRCENDLDFRKLVYEQCKRDTAYFINNFLWTYDDRIGEDEPLVLYPFQDTKMVKPYDEFVKVKAPRRVTLGYAKSRGQGFTWVELACRLKMFLFANNWSILIGTENRDDVDDGGQNATHESLYGKLRYMIRHLPVWFVKDLLGPLFKREEFNKRHHLQNPLKPKNVIHGKQLGGMFGRSRRYSEAFADEVAWADEMKDANTALKQTTNRFTFGSTPRGEDNFFAAAMRGIFPGVVKFWMWWGEHPMCDLAWYNAQRQDMDDDDVAQELDISFTMSVGGRVLDRVKIATHFISIADTPFLYSNNLELEVIIDPGFADALAMVWGQWDVLDGKGRVNDFVQGERNAVAWCVPFILGKIPELTYRLEPWPFHYNEMERAIIARHGEWSAPVFVYGDKAGGAKTWTTGTSAWDELSRYEIYVDEIAIVDDAEALKRTELFMDHVRVSDHLLDQRNGPRRVIPTFGEVLTQWRYPKRKRDATTTNKKPVHNVYCHGGDCMKMWAQTRDLPDAAVQPAASGRVQRGRGNDIQYDETYNPPFSRE